MSIRFLDADSAYCFHLAKLRVARAVRRPFGLNTSPAQEFVFRIE